MCLSATIFAPEELTTVKRRLCKGVPLFDALIRGESPYPAAQNFVTKNNIHYGENPESLSIWPGLQSIAGRDRQMDRIMTANMDLSTMCCRM